MCNNNALPHTYMILLPYLQAFQQHIAPTMKFADIVVPRGAENNVAMQLIVHHVKDQLEKVYTKRST